MSVSLNGTTGLTFADSSTQNTGGYTGFRNRIINGCFNVWQRGTSFAVTGSVNDYSADRWRTEGYSVNSTISRQSFTSGQTDVPGNPTYYCRVALSSAPSNFWAFQQRIEAPQMIRGDGTFTLSFYARATSGTVAAGTFSYGLNAATISNPMLTTTWQKLTATVTLSSVSEAAGYISVYIVNVVSSVSSLSVDIANVQVEVGSVATPFENRPYGMELSLCQRYYQLIRAASGTPNSSSICVFCIQPSGEMRAAPTAGQTGVMYISDYSTGDLVQSSVGLLTFSSYVNQLTVGLQNYSGLVALRPTFLRGNNANAITLSAEL